MDEDVNEWVSDWLMDVKDEGMDKDEDVIVGQWLAAR